MGKKKSIKNLTTLQIKQIQVDIGKLSDITEFSSIFTIIEDELNSRSKSEDLVGKCYCFKDIFAICEGVIGKGKHIIDLFMSGYKIIRSKAKVIQIIPISSGDSDSGNFTYNIDSGKISYFKGDEVFDEGIEIDRKVFDEICEKIKYIQEINIK